MVNRILDWLGRRVGCWIDASEFLFLLLFFFGGRKKNDANVFWFWYRFWESVSEISAQ